MKRPLTTGHLGVPLPSDSVEIAVPMQPAVFEAVVDDLLTLVAAAETQPAGPATKAYRAAIRRKGGEIIASGSGEALEAVLRQVCDAAPDRAERRERILTEAWTDLPGWRS
ncbi:hypothetical protein C0214_23945 [Methylobacterium sp. DM1]|nr:hypothetical protein C0214_23945 [Methylobacterium sp. DM1]